MFFCCFCLFVWSLNIFLFLFNNDFWWFLWKFCLFILYCFCFRCYYGFRLFFWLFFWGEGVLWKFLELLKKPEKIVRFWGLDLLSRSVEKMFLLGKSDT